MDSLTVGLGANSTKSIRTMNKIVIKEINKLLGNPVCPKDTKSDRVDYDLQTVKVIDFLTRSL